MRRLFGTDGIRGEAGEPPLDPDTVSQVGAALAASLRREGFPEPIQVVVGRDTRESSAGIAAAVAGGVSAANGIVRSAGVIPTPGVAHLVQALEAQAGVVVSASHNPWRDNGVKVFSAIGRKLPDAVEAEIEEEIDRANPGPPVDVPVETHLRDVYVQHLTAALPHALKGLRVVVDAANGAAFEVAPAAFRDAGADVIAIHVEPDGRNINENCGALHPEHMIRTVKENRADLGIALDGDADRIVVACDAGRLLDGDDILYLWTLELLRQGRKPAAVVGTVMSNFGLEKALEERGVRLVRAAVGDRYVAEEMENGGFVLGGEPSGHLIRADLSTTGDGILTGLHLAALVAASEKPLSAHPRLVHTPQVLKNVHVSERVPFETIPGLAAARERCEGLLDGHGRILLRYSGTEKLARVMVEGTDATIVESVASELARTIQDAIGV